MALVISSSLKFFKLSFGGSAGFDIEFGLLVLYVCSFG